MFMLLACGPMPQAEEGSIDVDALSTAVPSRAVAEVQAMSTSLPNYNVLLKRVRYCKNWLCTRAETPSEFREWEQANVDRGKQRETYISVLSQPPISQVRHVVFISAGQQTTLDGNGYNNVLTGQPADYKKNCKGQTRSCWRTIDGRSLARRVLASGIFPLSSTLFVLVFDARINYEIGSNEKQKIENAYFQWLTHRASSSQLETIYLAGQSRGGCLAYRLGKRFRDHSGYRSVPLIVQGYDAVCNKQQGEFGTTGTKYDNPLNSRYYSWRIDMAAQFPYRTDLALKQIHAGQQVVWIAPFGVRALTYRSYDVDLGWWRQNWVNLEHSDMGRNYANRPYTLDPGMQHLLDKYYAFH